MVKALKYICHYAIDFVHGDFGEMEELFIPDYGIVVHFLDGSLRVFPADGPRTDAPVTFTPALGVTRDFSETMPTEFRNSFPSPITEVELPLLVAMNLREFAEACLKMEKLRETAEKDMKQYIQ